MVYYHDLITHESWEELIRLNKLIPFVLIGGWATYLYTKSLKSKDIDIVIDYPALGALKKVYDVHKNERLRKYEAVKGPVQIDIYLPHYSRLGIPAGEILKGSRVIEGFSVVHPDTLFALKLITLADRGRTPKGRKDFLDILSLAQSQTVSMQKVVKLLSLYNKQPVIATFQTFLHESTQVPELALNTHQFSKLKKILIF